MTGDSELSAPELTRADLPVLEDPYFGPETVVEDVMLGQARTKEMMTPAEVATGFTFGFSQHAGLLDGADLLFDGGYTHTYA